MQTQETIDRIEGEAIARYHALRTAFGPCWGARAPARIVRVRRRPVRQGWEQWLAQPG